MKIICVSCPEGAPEIEESMYTQHMTTNHPSGQLASIHAKKNVPKKVDLPPGVTPSDLPDPTFLATVAEMEKEASQPKKPVVSQPSKPQDKTLGSINPVAEKKPPKLTYKYEGSCDEGHPLHTLEIDAKGDHFVIAYCIPCAKEVESREVANLGGSISIKNVEGEIVVKKRGRPKNE